MRTQHVLSAVCLAWIALTPSALGQQVIDIAEDWKFSTDPDAVGEQQGWAAAGFADENWAVLNAGMRWEDQGFAEYDGHAWYRKWVTVPDGWLTSRVYLAFGGINDAAAVYVNGKKVATLGYHEESKKNESLAREFQSIDITPYIEAGADNLTARTGAKVLIAVDVFDWGKSGGLWVLPCALALNPESMSAVEATCAVDYAARELLLRVQQVSSRPVSLEGDFAVTVTPEGGDTPVLETRVPIAPDASPTECALPLPYSPRRGHVHGSGNHRIAGRRDNRGYLRENQSPLAGRSRPRSRVRRCRAAEQLRFATRRQGLRSVRRHDHLHQPQSRLGVFQHHPA